MNKICGTGVALITPFNLDGSIDYLSLDKLIRAISQRKVNIWTNSKNKWSRWKRRSQFMGKLSKTTKNTWPSLSKQLNKLVRTTQRSSANFSKTATNLAAKLRN